MENRVFQDALELAMKDFGSSAQQACLKCHSPLGVHLGDFALEKKVSWEGVTCDYCHSVRSVDFDSENPKASVQFSLVKTGPMREASAVGHETAYSEVHTSSLICAPCHEYRNAKGYPVLETYSEWRASRYGRENVGCQTCHMGVVEADLVRTGLATSEGQVNLHEMPGGHSLKQLNKALQMRLDTSRSDDRLNLTVTVINGGGGHYVPTGSAMRKVVLNVKADPQGRGEGFDERRVFHRVVADEQGRPISHEHLLFFEGAKVLSDTRLAPEEERVESFSFAIPKTRPVRLEATLTYYYSHSSTEAARVQEELIFRSIKRFVR
jgi:hypothetical protein